MTGEAKQGSHQLLRLPLTLNRIRRIVAEDFSNQQLDTHLASFERFQAAPDDGTQHARPWEKITLRLIGPQDVTGISVAEIAGMMAVAMEIEEPIESYSANNGEGFRILLPSLARFMGKNRDELEEARRLGKPWCESPWCAEERRHANAFFRILERIMPAAPARTNPNRPRTATPGLDSAVALLISREAAEWNSASTYTVMSAHAGGELHTLLRNIARDEIKHLCVLSAADLHLFGPRRWHRFALLVRQGLEEYRGQKRQRTAGEQIGRNPATAFEVIAAHILAERRMRRWLRRLSAGDLARVFRDRAESIAHRIS